MDEPFSSSELHIETKARVHHRFEIELNMEIFKFAVVNHMTIFRPLWRLYSRRPYNKLHGFVIMKVLGGNTLFSAFDRYHAFTAVTSRVCIDLCANNEE